MPIFEEQLRDVVRQYEAKSYAVLHTLEEHLLSSSITGTFTLRYSIAGGLSAIAMHDIVRWRQSHLDADKDAALRCLDASFAGVRAMTSRPSLYQGFIGVAYVAEMAQCNGFTEVPITATDSVHDALLIWFGASKWEGPHDLVDGLVGIGLYALMRTRLRGDCRLITEVLKKLADHAEVHPHGLMWRTAPRWMSEGRLRRHPNGCYDLGMAHGGAGVIAFLAKVVFDSSIPVSLAAVAKDLLSKAVIPLQMFGSHDEPQQYGGFAFAADSERARNAWCYGDPGVGCAFYAAGRALDDHRLIAHGISLLINSTRSAAGLMAIDRPGVCHGAAGLVQMYMRGFQWSGDATLKNAAERWLAVILSDSLCVAPQRYAHTDGSAVMSDDAGALEGRAGIGMVLCDAIRGEPTDWDEILLL